MKKFFILCLMAIVVCSCNLEQKRIAEERARFVADSIATRKLEIADSLAKAREREKFVADSIRVVEFETKNKAFFTFTKDEFSNVVWVQPKNAPKYRSANGIYCYFALIDNKPQNFRFVFQYYAEDWLFIKNIIFNIDGENYCITPTMKTDCGYGGKIWEWCDTKVYKTCPSDEITYNEETDDIDLYAELKAEAVVNETLNDIRYSQNGILYTDINESFIKKLASAKSVKIKMNGSKYYDTKTLTQTEIASLNRTYTYFTLLKGEF